MYRNWMGERNDQHTEGFIQNNIPAEHRGQIPANRQPRCGQARSRSPRADRQQDQGRDVMKDLERASHRVVTAIYFSTAALTDNKAIQWFFLGLVIMRGVVDAWHVFKDSSPK